MSSLQQRLQLSLGVSLLLSMGLLWWLVSHSFQLLSEDTIVSRLAHDGESLLAALEFSPAGEARLDERRIDAIYTRPFSGHYYVLALPDGETLRSRSLWDTKLQLAPLEPGQSARSYTQGPEGQPLLVWSGGFRKQGRNLSVSVAEDISLLNQRLERLSLIFALLAGLILVTLLLIQRGIVRHTFGFQRNVEQNIRQLASGEVSELTTNVPDEIRPLVTEVNRLLQLTAQRLERSRNALGNLAHALKTPLNLLQQLAADPRLADHPQLSADLNQQLECLRQLLERELKRARLAGAATPGARFDPAAELPALIQLLERIYADKGLVLHYAIDEAAILHADRDDMLELLGNLLDNACKWAQKEVRCRILGNGQWHLRIEDDGPGCSDEAMRQLTERGTRIDESVSGHGLGLAISRDIVRLYRGRLHFERSEELGGLLVEVELPVVTG